MDAHCYVRMSSADRELVERACEHAWGGSTTTNKKSVAQWLLAAGLAAAKEELGEA